MSHRFKSVSDFIANKSNYILCLVSLCYTCFMLISKEYIRKWQIIWICIQKHIQKATRFLLSNKVFSFFSVIIVVWFIFQSVWFIYNIKPNTSPDEFYHYDLIHIYAEKSGISPVIHEQEDPGLGDVTRTSSYFYHYIVGLMLKIPLLAHFDEVFLRGISFVLTLGTVLIFLKLLHLLSDNKWVKLMSLLMFTNTLMFVFLSAGITYDHMANLFSILSIYLFVKLFYKFSAETFGRWLLIVLIASIVKFTTVPLALIECILLIWKIWPKRQKCVATSKAWFTDLVVVGRKAFKCVGNLSKCRAQVGGDLQKEIVPIGSNIQKGQAQSIGILVEDKPYFIYVKFMKKLMLIIFIFIAIGLVGERYGANLMKYHNFEPHCDQVHTVEQCMQNGVYARNYNLANDIWTEGWAQRRPVSTWGFTVNWVDKMFDWTYGIATHKWLEPAWFTKIYVEGIFLATSIISVIGVYQVFASTSEIETKESSLVGSSKNTNVTNESLENTELNAGHAILRNVMRFICKLDSFMRSSVIPSLFIIAMFYTLLLWAKHYSIQLRYERLGLAISGRYLFPVLPVIYFLVNYKIFGYIRNGYLRVVYFLLTAVVFVSSSLPYFVSEAGEQWFR